MITLISGADPPSVVIPPVLVPPPVLVLVFSPPLPLVVLPSVLLLPPVFVFPPVELLSSVTVYLSVGLSPLVIGLFSALRGPNFISENFDTRKSEAVSKQGKIAIVKIDPYPFK